MVDNIKIFEFDITDSTNLRAREYVRAGGALPSLFTAVEQTAGRGRQGKSFFSPKNTGLYMTLALPFDKSVKNSVTLTSAVSVAALQTLLSYTEKSLSIKWVNDILADGKKVAGILCETVADAKTSEIKAVLIGIGVNLTTKNFPTDVGQAVTNLSDRPVDRNQVAKDIANQIFSVIYSEDKASVMNEYRKASAVIGKEIYYIKNGIMYDAKAVGINDIGGLEVIHPDGTALTLTSGEISLRIKPTV